MQSLTKAQLAAELEASHVAYQRLLDQATHWQRECARLTEHVAAGRYVRPADAPRGEYAAKCAAARHQAMSTRSTVKVG